MLVLAAIADVLGPSDPEPLLWNCLLAFAVAAAFSTAFPNPSADEFILSRTSVIVFSSVASKVSARVSTFSSNNAMRPPIKDLILLTRSP